MINIRNNKLISLLSHNYFMKSFSLISLSQAITAVTNFGLLSLYTKYLPPSEFGKIALIWMFVIIVSILIDGGLNTAFSIRYYKVSKEENTKHVYTIFTFNLIVVLLAYSFFKLFPALFQKILKLSIVTTDLNVVFLLILFMIVGKFYNNILILSKKPKDYFFVNMFFNIVLILSSIVCLILLRDKYIAYLKSYLFAYLALFIMGVKYFIVHFKPKRNVISYSKIMELLKLGIPLVPTTLVLMLVTWADRYILNIYCGLTIVGVYTAGYRFAGLISSFIIAPFGQAMAPYVFKQYAESIDEYRKTMGRIFKYYWISIICILIMYFVFVKELFNTFIGEQYVKGYNVIAILLFGVIFWGATSLLGATIIMKEKTKRMFLYTTISVLMNIGLNYLLIPKYGMYGAAVASLFSYIALYVMVYSYTQRLVFIEYDFKFIIKSWFVSVLFYGAVLYVSYLKIGVMTGVLLKFVIFLLFVLISFKYMGLNKIIKSVVDYEGISRQAIS